MRGFLHLVMANVPEVVVDVTEVTVQVNTTTLRLIKTDPIVDALAIVKRAMFM